MQARRVMHAIWGAGQMSFTKFIVIVDEQVNVHDEHDVLFHLFSNCDPSRDVEITRGPVDILDHASPDLGAGSKMGFDATVKLPAEGKVVDLATRVSVLMAEKSAFHRTAMLSRGSRTRSAAPASPSGPSGCRPSACCR